MRKCIFVSGRLRNIVDSWCFFSFWLVLRLWHGFSCYSAVRTKTKSVLSSSIEIRSMFVTNAFSRTKRAFSPVLAKVFCKHPWLTWEDSSYRESYSYSQTLTLIFGILKHVWFVIHYAWSFFRFLVFQPFFVSNSKGPTTNQTFPLFCEFTPMFLARKLFPFFDLFDDE